MTYKNIVFDIGRVLFDYRWKEMFMDCGLEEEEALRVGNLIFADPEELWHEMDLGNRSVADITEEYVRRFPEEEEYLRWFIAHGEYMQVPRPRVWKMVHRLKEKGYNIYLLSNYPKDHFYKHTEYADFMKDVDGYMVSFMIHETKPSPAIYQALMDKYRLKPEECLFFDDRKENVEGAIALGMASKQVLSQEGLLEDLKLLVEE